MPGRDVDDEVFDVTLLHGLQVLAHGVDVPVVVELAAPYGHGPCLLEVIPERALEAVGHFVEGVLGIIEDFYCLQGSLRWPMPF